MELNVILYALGANITFALGSQVYTHFSRSISSVWMNCFKALVAFLAFGLCISITGSWHAIPLGYVALFLVSGSIGLGIGDIFLLKAFSLMGPGRTLLIFGFQPLIIGTLSYFILDQSIDSRKFWAIFFCILCLGIMSLESYKKSGHWELKGIAMALVGMSLDSCGVIITRYTFDHNPGMDSMEGNFYRTMGALLVFMLLSTFHPFAFVQSFKSLGLKARTFLIGGSLLGTFCSLGFYLKAMQSAHLASLAGLSITGIMFASLFECLIEKRAFSRYLFGAFLCSLCGMKIMLF